MLHSSCLLVVNRLDSNISAIIQMLAALNVANMDGVRQKMFAKTFVCQLHASHIAVKTLIAVHRAVKIISAWILRIAPNSHPPGLSGFSASQVVSL